ncbi:MAG: D-sedoheptulose-7-phosphate isomerase [Massiliimalia sp.]|jgi:D-sedoheptulose 7-phosphate isomerase
MSKTKLLDDLAGRFPQLNMEVIQKAYQILLECAQNQGCILTCGNGGSASDAEHIVGELMKGFRLPRTLNENQKAPFLKYGEQGSKTADSLQNGIRSICLNSQTALLTAVGNDNGYDMVFAQQTYLYGASGDVLIAMSTSGNSANVVNAAVTAKAKQMKVIGITGQKGGLLEQYSDVCICLPAGETYQIQELTLPLYHALCADLETDLFHE